MTCYCIILQKYKNTVAGIDTKLHLRISYISTLDNTGTERRNFKRILLTVSLSLIYIRHHNPCDYDVLRCQFLKYLSWRYRHLCQNASVHCDDPLHLYIPLLEIVFHGAELICY